MQIFIDSADVKQIETWLAQGVVDGATTNPSIMYKDGVKDVEQGARELAALLGDGRSAWKSLRMITPSCWTRRVYSQHGRGISSSKFPS